MAPSVFVTHNSLFGKPLLITRYSLHVSVYSSLLYVISHETFTKLNQVKRISQLPTTYWQIINSGKTP